MRLYARGMCFAFGLLIACGSLGCGDQLLGPRHASGAQLRTDTYAVYVAALDSFARVRPETLPVADHTWPYTLASSLNDTSAFYRSIEADTGAGRALLRAYDRANIQDTILCDCFPRAQRVKLIPHGLRPGVPGQILLSNVAFNEDRTRALVTVAWVCGALCASWNTFLVVRRSGVWRVSRSVRSGSA
jgi:hypothetical protein